MIKPADIKVDPNRPYAFKSPLKVFIVRWVDAIGRLLFRPAGTLVSWQGVRRIAVLRLDHLGDVLLALPALRELERALPNAQVDFFIGPWAKDLVEMAGLRAIPKIFTASWFTREGVKGETVAELKDLLRDGQYDAVIELRGDFRHIWAMYRAGIRNRIGLAKTGLGFLLTHPSIYRVGQHEMKRNMDVLGQAGIPLSGPQEFPRLYPRKEDEQIQMEIRQKLGITRPVIAIHAVCSALSKRWPVSNWQKLINGLPGDVDIALVGTEGEKPGMTEIESGCNRKVFSTAGLLSLPVLAAFLKECRLFIGVDSGPAHIAAAVGTPVVSLYSGTNQVEQWGPQGQKVAVIQKKTVCSPCELTVCPLGNECMNLIQVEEVLDLVSVSLQK